MGKSNISQKDAYKLMLKEYPDIMTVEQMCEVLGISTKTGYRLMKNTAWIFLRSSEVLL